MMARDDRLMLGAILASGLACAWLVWAASLTPTRHGPLPLPTRPSFAPTSALLPRPMAAPRIPPGPTSKPMPILRPRPTLTPAPTSRLSLRHCPGLVPSSSRAHPVEQTSDCAFRCRKPASRELTGETRGLLSSGWICAGTGTTWKGGGEGSTQMAYLWAVRCGGWTKPTWVKDRDPLCGSNKVIDRWHDALLATGTGAESPKPGWSTSAASVDTESPPPGLS
jgi:hypothetical protein